MRQSVYGIIACCVLSLGVASAPSFAQNIPRSSEPDTLGRELKPVPLPTAPPIVGAPPEETTVIPPGAEEIQFTLKKVVVEGSTVYPRKELARTYKEFIGRHISLADIYIVADRITQRYLADGYLLSKAYLPPQSIGEDGKVTIRIIEGHISRVRWEGDELDSDLARSIAHRLETMIPLRGSGLESTILSLNDLPGVQVKATLAPGAIEGEVEAVLNVTRKRIDASLEADDLASRYLGVWQSNAQANINGLLSPVDKLALGASSSFDPSLSRFVSAAYTLPVDSSGTSLLLGANYGKTAPGFTLTDLNVIGSSKMYWMGVSQSVMHSRLESMTVSSQLNIKELRNDILDTPLYTDRVRTLQLSGTYSRGDMWNGSNLISIDVFEGLNILDATRTGSPMLSRPDGHSEFTRAVLSASRLQAINDEFSLMAAVTGQVSDAPLLNSEQFGFGGSPFGRAYDPNAITGDEGMAGSLELRYSTAVGPHLDLQPYVFYDIGEVWNRGVPGDEKSGASGGLGCRFQIYDAALLDTSIAKPLTLPAAPPKLGASGNDPRFNVSLKFSF